MAFLSLAFLLHTMICCYCYKDGEVLEFVSPPFLSVALDAYSSTEIESLLLNPADYSPWGKAGVANSIMYYIRNARLCIQYHGDPTGLMINNENHNTIWSRIFKLEMDIFTSFRDWFQHRNRNEKWEEFVYTVYDVFNNSLRYYLDEFSALESFPIEMPIFEEYGIGPKFETKTSIKNVASNIELDKTAPFIPTLNDLPLIGFGSWPLTGDECKDTVLKALKTGYRLIDSSENYNNEQQIGEAIRESGIDRSEILIASKLSFDRNYGEGVTTEAFYKTLSNLGIDYIDVYMLHGAIVDKKRLKEAWQELEKLYRDGKIKYLGVSNYDPKDMQHLLSYATIKPSFVQNKFDPFTQGQQTPWRPSIHEWVIHYNENVRGEDEELMIVQGYCVLNSWPHQISAVNDKHIKWIADKYKVTSAQLLIRWALQHKYVGILTRSSNKDRQLNNLNIFDFEINDVDMQLINGLLTLFSPFDVPWMHDVYGQISNRPRIQPERQEL